MAGYGLKEARIDRRRKPTDNVCGQCGADCDGLLCFDCRGTLAPGSGEFEEVASYTE